MPGHWQMAVDSVQVNGLRAGIGYLGVNRSDSCQIKPGVTCKYRIINFILNFTEANIGQVNIGQSSGTCQILQDTSNKNVPLVCR